MDKKTQTEKREVPEKKKKIVKDVVKLINNNNSILIASIKSLPLRQLQIATKNFRGKAEIKVLKKSIVKRAIEESKHPGIKKLEPHIKEDIAFIFSNLEVFELSAMLGEKKSPVKAKAGQVAEADIEIEPGPTELVPGPVISELGALGLKIAIEDGKINIREKKVVVKKGEKVSDAAASILAKFDIKPFYVGLEPLIGYDKKQDKLYENIKVDKVKNLEEFKKMAGRAIAFAVSLSYACKDTIKYLLGRALSHEKALDKFIKPTENVQGGQ
jgi:large subunit ribosomal protein L10